MFRWHLPLNWIGIFVSVACEWTDFIIIIALLAEIITWHFHKYERALEGCKSRS